MPFTPYYDGRPCSSLSVFPFANISLKTYLVDSIASNVSACMEELARAGKKAQIRGAAAGYYTVSGFSLVLEKRTGVERGRRGRRRSEEGAKLNGQVGVKSLASCYAAAVPLDLPSPLFKRP